MLYTILSFTLGLLAAVFLFFSIRTLLKKQWLRAWLRGTLSLGTILLSIGLVAVAWDFMSYSAVEQNQTVATVGVKLISPQEYQLEVAIPEGGEESYVIRGDLWQLDARLITWSGPFKFVGMKPGYRLDRLSGRYLTLEQEQNSERTVYSVSQTQNSFDVWAMVGENPWIPWVSAKYGSATYLPMRDGALYSVSLNQQGLIALPLNGPAKQAIEAWQ